ETVCVLCICAFPQQARGMTVSGPITASSVTVSGPVTVSSMTASSMTVTSQFNIPGIASITGLIIQTLISSSTASNTTTSTTLTPIPGMSVTLALSNPNNYVRISLSGVLKTLDLDSTVSANASIERDSTDLGQGALSTAHGSVDSACTGITII